MRVNYAKYVTSWKTPREIVKAERKDADGNGMPYLWGKQDVQPLGTQQGYLGTCWFLASCSALAEYPERIKKIFANKAYPANGVFHLKLHEMDEEVGVTVDD